MDDLAQDAINAALSCDWGKAILLNSQIIKENPEDIDALNRIAKAYAENGDILKAKKTTKKVLKLDPLNTIANKCVTKWENFKKGSVNNNFKLANFTFIEDPITTKLISLINLGDQINIVNVDSGDIVKLEPHTHRLNVITLDGKYLGRFPDNIAYKFIKLIKTGGNFQAIVKSASKKEVKIFVKANSRNGF